MAEEIDRIFRSGFTKGGDVLVLPGSDPGTNAKWNYANMTTRIMTPKDMKATVIGTALVLVFGVQTEAANIALTDPSLESAFGGLQSTVVSGWFTFGSAAGGTDVSGDGFWNMTNTHGNAAAYATALSDTDGGSIYQRVNLDAGVTYTMTVAIGCSSGAPKTNADYSVVFYNSNFSTQLAATIGVATFGTNVFTDASVSFTPTVSGDYFVGMRNRGFVPGTGANNNQSTVFFDNVRLVAVPEPAAALLGGFGMLCLLRRRR